MARTPRSTRARRRGGEQAMLKGCRLWHQSRIHWHSLDTFNVYTSSGINFPPLYKASLPPLPKRIHLLPSIGGMAMFPRQIITQPVEHRRLLRGLVLTRIAAVPNHPGLDLHEASLSFRLRNGRGHCPRTASVTYVNTSGVTCSRRVRFASSWPSLSS